VTAGTFGHGTTVLIAVLKGAARVSDLTKVTTLVKRLVALEGCGQALLNTCDKKGRSPLHHAAASGHPGQPQTHRDTRRQG
jgi:ankyrin repeat protein